MKEIKELLNQMTLEEKASLCSGLDFWHLKNINRLEIPSIMVTDGPHGLRKQAGNSDHIGLNQSIPSTCFPTASALASTWNRDLVFVSDKTRLAIVTPAKNAKNLKSHLVHGLVAELIDLNIPMEQAQFEIDEMKDSLVSKTRSRSILGTMNDYKYHVGYQIEYFRRKEPREISQQLNKIPIGSLDYRYPIDLTIEAFQASYERPLFD